MVLLDKPAGISRRFGVLGLVGYNLSKNPGFYEAPLSRLKFLKER